MVAALGEEVRPLIVQEPRGRLSRRPFPVRVERAGPGRQLRARAGRWSSWGRTLRLLRRGRSGRGRNRHEEPRPACSRPPGSGGGSPRPAVLHLAAWTGLVHHRRPPSRRRCAARHRRRPLTMEFASDQFPGGRLRRRPGDQPALRGHVRAAGLRGHPGPARAGRSGHGGHGLPLPASPATRPSARWPAAWAACRLPGCPASALRWLPWLRRPLLRRAGPALGPALPKIPVLGPPRLAAAPVSWGGRRRGAAALGLATPLLPCGPLYFLVGAGAALRLGPARGRVHAGLRPRHGAAAVAGPDPVPPRCSAGSRRARLERPAGRPGLGGGAPGRPGACAAPSAPRARSGLAWCASEPSHDALTRRGQPARAAPQPPAGTAARRSPTRAWPQTGFCCSGCAYVHRLVHEHGLDAYYRIKDPVTAPADAGGLPAAGLRLARGRAGRGRGGGRRTACRSSLLDIQGISCAGCVWLIERCTSSSRGPRHRRQRPAGLDAAALDRAASFRAAAWARRLQAFGYLLGPAGEKPAELESRALVRRIGLCAAFALNVMLFTLPGLLRDGPRLRVRRPVPPALPGLRHAQRPGRAAPISSGARPGRCARG